MSVSASIFDRFAMAVSPSWGAKRIEARKKHELSLEAMEYAKVRMKRTWDAADQGRERGDSWLTSGLSPIDALETDIASSRDRAEDLCFNNCYGAALVNARVDNVVGRGFRLQSRIEAFGDLISAKDAKSLNESIESVLSVWARIDKLRQKQRLFEQSKAVYGEGIAVLANVRRPESPIPLTVKIMSPKRLETPPELSGEKLVRLGIRFSDTTYSTPVGYYFRTTHPNDSKSVEFRYEYIPAERVCHSFEQLRPGHVRGIPWLSPVMNEIKDLGDFKEARLISEQVAACASVFVKSPHPYARAVGAASETNSAGQRVEELYPGRVEYIGEDEEVTFVDPNRPGSTMEPFMSWYLHGVSAATRMPYEMLTKMFTNSFAGGRLALSDGKITFQCWQRADIDDFLTPVYHAALNQLVALRKVAIDPVMFRAFPHLYQKHAWIPQEWPYAVNPLQEANADVAMIDGGLATETDRLGVRGADFDETVATRTRERIAHLEADAAVEKRRMEIAKELGVESFGKPAEEKQQEQYEEEPEEVASA